MAAPALSRLGLPALSAPIFGGTTAGGLGSFPMNDFSPTAGEVALGSALGGGGGGFGGAVGGPLSFGDQTLRQGAGVAVRGGIGNTSNAVVATVKRKDGC